MTYAEKMTKEIKESKTFMSAKWKVNQIIADTKRACLESLNRVNKFSGRPFTSYGDVIEEAEVKEK